MCRIFPQGARKPRPHFHRPKFRCLPDMNWGDFRLLTQLENNARASPRLTSPVWWGSGEERGTVVPTWKWIHPFVVLLDSLFWIFCCSFTSSYMLEIFSTSMVFCFYSSDHFHYPCFEFSEQIWFQTISETIILRGQEIAQEGDVKHCRHCTVSGRSLLIPALDTFSVQCACLAAPCRFCQTRNENTCPSWGAFGCSFFGQALLLHLRHPSFPSKEKRVAADKILSRLHHFLYLLQDSLNFTMRQTEWERTWRNQEAFICSMSIFWDETDLFHPSVSTCARRSQPCLPSISRSKKKNTRVNVMNFSCTWVMSWWSIMIHDEMIPVVCLFDGIRVQNLSYGGRVQNAIFCEENSIHDGMWHHGSLPCWVWSKSYFNILMVPIARRWILVTS